MTALAADMRMEAARFSDMSNDELCSDLNRFSLTSGEGYGSQLAMKLVSAVHPHLRGLWGSVDQTDLVNSTAWLADPSGHAEAAMQLCTASLQHISSVMQYVLPAVRQQGPHHAAQCGVLQQNQCKAMAAALNLMIFHDREIATIQTQAHLSPHCLLYLAPLLVLFASWLSRGSLQAISSSSSGGDPTPAQLQLFKLLGLSPELIALPPHPQMRRRPQAVRHLEIILTACIGCYSAVAGACAAPAPQQQGSGAAEQQRWQNEQQLWLLLPLVLLPCASKVLLLAQHQADAGIQRDAAHLQAEERCVCLLLEQSGRALVTYSRLSSWLGREQELQWPCASAWLREVLGMVLHLADRLLLLQHRLLQQQQQQGAQQQQQQQQGQAAATPAVAAANSGISIGGQTSCAGELLALLSTLAYESRRWCHTNSTARARPKNGSTGISHATADAEASVPPPSEVPVVAERFGQVCTALEAGLRAVTAALQSRSVAIDSTIVGFCLRGLLIADDDCVTAPLASHIGLRGPAALFPELRQFYSVLSTVQKLCRCKEATTDKLCWGQQAANTCCWAAGRAAVGLLQAPSYDCLRAAAAAAADSQHTTTPAALMVQQRPELSQLSSFVIFGRCCLFWSEQLQQMPVLLPSANAESIQQEELLLVGAQEEYSAALVCIPGWLHAAARRPCGLERLIAKAVPWLGALQSQTAAADRGARDPFGGITTAVASQLEALSTARQDVVREGLSGETLSALVQQLQTTGLMLSNISVPHFCNNPTCSDLSGLTDVRLVLRPNTICAGCLIARYCGRGCQHQAWPQHRRMCKALAAAVAAAASDAAVDVQV